MKFDIENKILIPFMILIVLSVGILGSVSYWNGYRLLINNLREFQFDTISTVLSDLESEMPLDTNAKDKLTQFYQNLHKPGLFIYNQKTVYVDQLPEDADREKIQQAVDTTISRGVFENETIIITYGTEVDSGWTVAMVGAKRILVSELVDSQKYSILVAIISLILSMQATILIAHHLSRPIRQLADQCNQLSEGNTDIRLEIDRSDEIGTLAESFNQMIFKLQENTNKLIEVKQFNEDILRSLSTGVIVADENGQIINSNEAAGRLLLPSLYEVNTNERFETLLSAQLRESLSNQKPVEQLYVLQSNALDERRHYATTAALLRNLNEDITGAILSINDITERKRLELKMERMNRLASVGQLASGLAHEIRNPLAGMKTSVQVLKRRLVVESQDRNISLFDGILHEIDRLNHLITELLDFAKPRHAEPKKINLLEVIQQTVDWLQPAVTEKGMALNFEVPDLQGMIYADENQVEQILINILNNAIIASKSGDTIRITLKEVESTDKDTSEIIIADQGCGISEEDLNKVFDPFYSTHPNGTGLGLSVVHKLMTDNGGEINIQSTIGVGTTVKLRFPNTP